MSSVRKIVAFLAIVMLLITCCSVSIYADSLIHYGIKVDLTTNKDIYSPDEVIQVNLVVENTNSFEVNNVKIESLLPSDLKILGSSLHEINTLKAGEKVELTFNVGYKVEPELTATEPAVTEKPSLTQEPEETEEPIETTNPTETEKTEESELPTETLEPVETEEPVDTEEPTESTAPIKTEEPTATEPSSTQENDSSPKTGDSFDGTLLIMLVSAAVTGAILFIIFKKNRRKINTFLSLFLCVVLLAGGLGINNLHLFAETGEIKSFQVSHKVKIGDEHYVISVDVSFLHKNIENELSPDSNFLNPKDSGGGEINRLSWIAELIKYANLPTGLNYIKSDLSYSDVDFNNPFFEAQFPDYNGEVEIAMQNGIIPFPESEDERFYPERAATEAFAVVTAVKSLGFHYENLQDIYDIANNFEIFTGMPSANPLTQKQAFSILSAVAVISDVPIDPDAEQIVDIRDDVIMLSETDFNISYTFDEKKNVGEVRLPNEAKSMIKNGDCIILPPNENHYAGLAQKIVSISEEDDGTIVLQTVMPELEDILGEEGIHVQGHFDADINNFRLNPNLQDELGPEWNKVNKSAKLMKFTTFADSNPLQLTINFGEEDGRGFIDVELAIEEGDNSVSRS